MRLRQRHVLVLAALVGSFAVAVAVDAAAKDKKDKAKTAASASASASATADKTGVAKAIAPYDQAIIDASKAFVAALAGGNLDEAANGYRKAITVDPSRPEAHLYLSAVLFQKADWANAEQACTDATSRARADKAYVNTLGKALFMMATLKDAQAKRDDAKAAWQAYETFAKENPDQEMQGTLPEGLPPFPMLVKVYPASAADRQTKIDNYQKLEKDYAKVKELVLKRQKELGIEPTKKPEEKKP
jgi:tetratricopeptide (TPR) repeat protein